MWRQKSRKKCWPERQIQPGAVGPRLMEGLSDDH